MAPFLKRVSTIIPLPEPSLREYLLLFHYQSLIGVHQSGAHPVEPRCTRTELDSVASLYSVQDPLRHIWQ